MRSFRWSDWLRPAVLLCLLWGSVSAQDEDQAPKSDTILCSPEQTLTGYLPVSDSEDTELRMPQNPTAAMFKSMAVPGWGQLGNRRYIKAAVYASLELFFVAVALDYRSQANDLYDQYLAADSLYTKNAIFSLYDEKKNKRNRYMWFTAITVFISMFDAYVDAHLAGFPFDRQDSRLDLDVGPSEQYSLQAAVRFRF